MYDRNPTHIDLTAILQVKLGWLTFLFFLLVFYRELLGYILLVFLQTGSPRVTQPVTVVSQ